MQSIIAADEIVYPTTVFHLATGAKRKPPRFMKVGDVEEVE
jgi:hypothetical protein